MADILTNWTMAMRPTYQDQLNAAQNTVRGTYADYALRDEIIKNILAAKNAYGAANGDMQKQTAAHEDANVWRDYARKNNVDISALDNMNANQADAYYKTLQADARQKFLYRDTPQQFEARAKDKYLRQGMSEKDAIKAAHYDTVPYRADYMAEARHYLGDKGITNNAINTDVGMQLLNLMYGVDPQSVTLPTALLGHPADNLKFDQQLQKMRTVGDIQSGQSAQNYNQNKDLLNTRGEWQRVFNNDNHNYRMEEATHGANLDMQTMREKIASMSEAQRQEWAYLDNILEERYGISNPQDRLALLFQVKFGGGQNGKKQTQEKPLTESQKNLLGELQLNSKKLLQRDIDIREFEDFVAKNSGKLNDDEDIMQEIYNLKTLNEWWQNYNYGGKPGAGKTFENTIKQAKVILEDRNKDIQELAKKYGLWDYLKQYEKKDVNAPQNARLEK